MSPLHVELIAKATVHAGMHPNVLAACRMGEGHLIVCHRCLEKIHCAPWVLAGEIAQRLADFRAKHAGCR